MLNCYVSSEQYGLFDVVEAVVVAHEQHQRPQRRQDGRELLITIVDVSHDAGTQQCQLVLRRQTVGNLPHNHTQPAASKLASNTSYTNQFQRCKTI